MKSTEIMDSKHEQTLHADAVHRHLQNLWSNFNKLLNHPVTICSFTLPNDNDTFRSLYSSFSSFLGEHKDQSLTTYEIKNRILHDMPVYKIGNKSETRFILKSKPKRERGGKLELYCLSKPDAELDLMHAIGANEDDDDGEILDAPLADVVEFEGRIPPISLVPELSQVKNAIELKNKDRSKHMVELSFSGVPIFQSRCLSMEYDGTYYTPGFFRKEDLEKCIATTIEPKDRDIIKVSAFEDIIQKMKDRSTSESNDILFIGSEEMIDQMSPYQ